MRCLLTDREMRLQAYRHWAVWLCAGFGWTALVFSATLSTTLSTPRSQPQSQRAAPSSYRRGDELPSQGCHFDYWHQFLIMAMEIPGTLLVGLVVDSPQGPRGLCGGRRGVQVSAYSLCAVCALGAAVLPRAPALLCSMAARAVGAAANSAMWIAAPELYPTHVRGLGASVTSLFALLGAVPASAWVNTEQPAWLRAAGISIANVLAAAFAASLPETAGLTLQGGNTGIPTRIRRRPSSEQRRDTYFCSRHHSPDTNVT